MEAVANAFVNIEKIRFWYAHPNQILAFIRRSRKLSHIAIGSSPELKGNVLDLAFWNKEREKLIGSRKVTVYVPEGIFLDIKNASQNKDYRLIEIKRIDSNYLTLGSFSHFF